MAVGRYVICVEGSDPLLAVDGPIKWDPEASPQWSPGPGLVAVLEQPKTYVWEWELNPPPEPEPEPAPE